MFIKIGRRFINQSLIVEAWRETASGVFHVIFDSGHEIKLKGDEANKVERWLSLGAADLDKTSDCPRCQGGD